MIEDIIEKLEYNLISTDVDAPLSRQEQRIILSILKVYYEAKTKEENKARVK